MRYTPGDLVVPGLDMPPYRSGQYSVGLVIDVFDPGESLNDDELIAVLWADGEAVISSLDVDPLEEDAWP